MQRLLDQQQHLMRLTPDGIAYVGATQTGRRGSCTSTVPNRTDAFRVTWRRAGGGMARQRRATVPTMTASGGRQSTQTAAHSISNYSSNFSSTGKQPA